MQLSNYHLLLFVWRMDTNGKIKVLKKFIKGQIKWASFLKDKIGFEIKDPDMMQTQSSPEIWGPLKLAPGISKPIWNPG